MMLTRNAVLQNRYRIIDMIGQGGMGAVYQAIDQRLGNTVALKQTFFNDEELGRAFEREARLLASLRHSSLPRVSDHFVEGDGQFLVMEFIPGDDLAKLLKRKASPFDCDQVLEWGYQLLDVLDYLHSCQPPIIHRDIKPQNLKLTHRGQIILLDFGLAKGAPQLLEHGTASSLFGYTLNYAPLEQIQHTGTDPRSDLYSFGATLYHLMTARTPPGSLSRAVAIVNGAPDPLPYASKTDPSIPPEIAQVISQAMALRSEDRYATAAEMLKALRQACRRPSADYPVFGAIPTNAAPSALKPGDDSLKETPVFYPMEAVTQPMMKPVTYAALDTVPITPNPTSALASVSAAAKSPLKLYFAVFALVLLFAVVIVDRLRDSTPKVPTPTVPIPPVVAPPARPVLAQPPPALTGPITPSLDPPQLILLDPVAKNGIITLRWSPVPRAVRYEVELSNGDLSQKWLAAKTKKTVQAVRVDGSGFVSVTAIDAEGRRRKSQLWNIYSE